jgi:hypothetical protein
VRKSNVARCRIEMDRFKRLQELSGLLKSLSERSSAEAESLKLCVRKSLWCMPKMSKSPGVVKVDTSQPSIVVIDNRGTDSMDGRYYREGYEKLTAGSDLSSASRSGWCFPSSPVDLAHR